MKIMDCKFTITAIKSGEDLDIDLRLNGINETCRADSAMQHILNVGGIWEDTYDGELVFWPMAQIYNLLFTLKKQ